jgi:hypothetical protein
MVEIPNDLINQGKLEYQDFTKLCPIDQDPVLTILRAHLLTEYYMDQFISLLLPRGDKMLKKGNLTYYQKVILMDSLNTDSHNDRYIQCLKNLNKIRNDCAHEKDRKITLKDLELIGRPIGKPFTEMRRKQRDDIHQLLFSILANICGTISRLIVKTERAVLNKSTEN